MWNINAPKGRITCAIFTTFAEFVPHSEFFCLFVCLFVRHAFQRHSLCARFRHEGVGVHTVHTARMHGYQKVHLYIWAVRVSELFAILYLTKLTSLLT